MKTPCKPCKTCPFRNSTRFYLHEERLKEILSSVLSEGQIFQCHQYLNKIDPRNYRYVMPCVGSLILIKKKHGSVFHNLSNRILGYYDRLSDDEIDINTPGVVNSEEEFIETNL